MAAEGVGGVEDEVGHGNPHEVGDGFLVGGFDAEVVPPGVQEFVEEDLEALGFRGDVGDLDELAEVVAEAVAVLTFVDDEAPDEADVVAEWADAHVHGSAPRGE